ncbi:MAG TPA: HD domain-containing protein [Deltaproteobacteria bacterium]|nr:HD domain-containing protein [Deltaproteobacteria bacterium]
MKIPSSNKCLDLMRSMDMMEHIVTHSRRVCQVAACIAENLNHQSRQPNLKLVIASALLHDITKTRSFKTGENHAVTGARLLERLGYREVADIVRQHVRLDTYSASDSITEAEIVNYADKRVLHDQVVGLNERKDYIFEKYGKTPENRNRLNWLWKETKHLEGRIFQHMPFDPEQLPDYLTTPPVPAG